MNEGDFSYMAELELGVMFTLQLSAPLALVVISRSEDILVHISVAKRKRLKSVELTAYFIVITCRFTTNINRTHASYIHSPPLYDDVAITQ